MGSEWERALDALEEWARRTEQALADELPVLPAPPAPLPAGALPDGCRLRALALSARLEAATLAVQRLRSGTERDRRYALA